MSMQAHQRYYKAIRCAATDRAPHPVCLTAHINFTGGPRQRQATGFVGPRALMSCNSDEISDK